MAEDRLTPLDASFLHLENESAHMHVACAMVFEGAPPSYEEFVNRVERRLHQVPRYRQKLAMVPFGQGRPRWVDDPGFDVRYHVRASALARPGTEYELEVLASRVFSTALNREKPLWEIWLVEGLEGGRFAVLSKTHHALVDGISGLDILSVLFSGEETEQDADSWKPRPAPSSAELLAEALWERATSPGELIRPVRALLRRPRQVTRAIVETAVGVGAMAWAGLSPAPRTPYNRRVVGPNRRFVWVRGSLPEVKEMKNSLGGTVNDVILTVVTRALRRHLMRRGEDVEGLTLKAFVPVSVRSEDQQGTLGNQVSGMVAPLPVYCSNPTSCLSQISEAMSELKSSGQAIGAQALTELTGFAPPNLIHQGARLVTRQRFVNLVVTNVPGPQQALYFGEHELKDIFPMVPLGANMGLGVAIVSYNGTINFGLVGDFDTMPDLDELAEDFTAALGELASAAGLNQGEDRDSSDSRSRRASRGATTRQTNGHANGHRDLTEDAAPSADTPGRGPSGDPPGSGPSGDPLGSGGPHALSGDLELEAERAAATLAAELEPGAVDQPDGVPAPGALPGSSPEPLEAVTGAGHVDTDPVLVAASADPGAQDGAGAQLRVDAPWPGYERMRVPEITDRLVGADPELVAVVRLYESTHKQRRQVIRATERAMKT